MTNLFLNPGEYDRDPEEAEDELTYWGEIAADEAAGR